MAPALLAAAIAASGCGGARTTAPPPEPAPSPAARPEPGELGMATYYSAHLAGRATASGEPYRPGALTAAHRTLPIGTVVRVTRVDRHARPVAGPVLVRINDRGPYGAGRIIDLSAAAAQKLRMLRDGVARVKVEVVTLPPRARGRTAGN